MARLSQAEQDTILRNLKARYDYATREWDDIRREAAVDMRYVSGDPWDPKERQLRTAANRPCLSLDEIGQYVNQLVNEIRQHKRSIKVSPMTNGDERIARLRANLIRQIEYRSNAQIAYTTMFENAVQRSYGFLRITPRYEHPRSLYQELIIEPFENPDMVTVDPDDLSPVAAGIKYAFVHEWWNIADFVQRWPTAKVKGASTTWQQEAPRWWRQDRIQVAEYWTIESESRELLHLQPPDGSLTAAFADELEGPSEDANPEAQRRWTQRWGTLALAYQRQQATVVNRRTVDYPRVCQYMTNGIELLPPDPEQPDVLKHRWLGTSIPIVACYGKLLWMNDGVQRHEAGEVTSQEDGTGSKRKILSLPRLARDPAMLYCFYRTSQAELAGMTPKTPFIGYEGQFRGHELEWQKVHHEPLAFLEAKATTDATGQQILPLPQRQPYDPAIQSLEIGAESARRAIQAAMGIMPLPTDAQRQNQKSGIALERIQATSQRGSFHFIDHYDMSITEVGKKIDELLPHYYDAARDVTTRTASDELEQVRINDPQAPDQESGQPLMLTDDPYDVTLSTGPNADSEREAASDFADALATQPEMFAIIGDLVVKLKNLGPIGDEISERLRALLPPPVQQVLAAKETSPAQLMGQLQQAQQMIEVLSKELQAKTQAIEIDQVKAQQQLEIARLKAETDLRIRMAELEKERQETVAELTSKEAIELRKLEVTQQNEMAKLGQSWAVARAEIEQDQLHQHSEAEQREADRAEASAQADLDRQAERDARQETQAFEASKESDSK